MQVSFLLDETGSMQAVKDSTITAFNEFVAGVQKETPKARLTLVRFNSIETKVPYRSKKIKKVEKLSDYSPTGSTPLYDAACKLIDATAEKHPADKVVVVLQTDGQENASRLYTKRDLEDRIKEWTEKGWQFVFLGRDLDAYDTQFVSHEAIPIENKVSYTNDVAVMAATVENIGRFDRGEAVSMSYTSTQRSTSGDKFFEKEDDLAKD